jgi:putative tricarboxylic transport membrane protein
MIEFLNFLPVIIMAIAAGMITGLLPGLGPASIILILYPLLINFSITELFVFYSSMMASIQYYGSVSSIIYGVPGEINNTPALQYGHPEFRAGRGAELLASTATASMLASIIGLMFFSVAMSATEYLSWFLDNKPRLAILLVILFSIVVSVPNRVGAAIAVLLGIATGHIGFNALTNTYFLSSSNFLSSGIPLIPLFLSFLVLPEIVSYIRTPGRLVNWTATTLTLPQRIAGLFRFRSVGSVLRGSAIGSIAGLIPSIGTSISSIMAANFEKRITSDPSKLVISAEAANNSAATTVLIPFVLLALPIVPSEAIIMSLAERQGFGTTTAFAVMADMAPFIIITLLAVNTINWLLAGVFYQTIADVYQRAQHVIYHLVAMLCAGLIVYVGALNNQLQLYIAIATIGIVCGLIVKSFVIRLAFVFAFFLSAPLTSELYRFVLFNL